jgi:hypothetical protein
MLMTRIELEFRSSKRNGGRNLPGGLVLSGILDKASQSICNGHVKRNVPIFTSKIERMKKGPLERSIHRYKYDI